MSKNRKNTSGTKDATVFLRSFISVLSLSFFQSFTLFLYLQNVSLCSSRSAGGLIQRLLCLMSSEHAEEKALSRTSSGRKREPLNIWHRQAESGGAHFSPFCDAAAGPRKPFLDMRKRRVSEENLGNVCQGKLTGSVFKYSGSATSCRLQHRGYDNRKSFAVKNEFGWFVKILFYFGSLEMTDYQILLILVQFDTNPQSMLFQTMRYIKDQFVLTPQLSLIGMLTFFIIVSIYSKPNSLLVK